MVVDFAETLTVNRRSDNQCGAEDHGCNYYRQRDVVILFELLAHRKRRNLIDNHVCQCENHQAQQNE